jgi:threonine-phosphate decarboxylase
VAVSDAPSHGGNVHAAARELRRPVGSILDFSASINPLGPSRQAVRAFHEAASLVEHYPDPECFSLKRTMAHRWKLSPERVVVGSGSTELIDVIPRALAIRSAMIVGPTYGEYARAVRHAGGQLRVVLARKADNYRPPLEEVVRRLVDKRGGRQAIDAVFLCHPNSPTGRPCGHDDLRALFRAANRTRSWVILDESFIEYCGELTCVPYLRSFSRLIILRSFTKFYGLPGLRIGYSLSSASVAALLRRFLPPWSVSAVAQRAAEAAIMDERHTRRSLRYVEKERAGLALRLSSLEGVTVVPSSANFLLIELPTPLRARAITADLRRQGILVRDCSSVEGCTSRMIRIAVRASRDNDRLIGALARLLHR